MNLRYKTDISNLQSVEFHPLSKNGPFIDAHFGPLTDKMPVGQTYYIRPLTEYMPPCENNLVRGCGCGGKGDGYIKFNLNKCFPSTHFNTNSTSTDFSIDGEITISPFEWDKQGVAKKFDKQTIDVNLNIINNTGLELSGFHIHDGVTKNTMAGFGKISYFLTTSSEWQNRYNIDNPSVIGPLPHTNMVLKNPEFLTVGRWNKSSRKNQLRHSAVSTHGVLRGPTYKKNINNVGKRSTNRRSFNRRSFNRRSFDRRSFNRRSFNRRSFNRRSFNR